MKYLLVLLFALASFDVDATSISVPMQINGTTCSNFTPAVSGSSVIYNCVGSSPGAPTNCVATVNGATAVTLPSTGGTAALTVSCTQTSGVTYNWAKNGTSGTNTNRQWTDTLPANSSTSQQVNYTYQVSACIGTACATAPNTPLTLAVLPSGAFTGTCPGFAATHVIPMVWASPTRMFTSNFGGFGPSDAVVVTFTTGAGTSVSNNLPKIGGAEYIDPPQARYAVLSATPCDFGAQPMPGASNSGYSVTVPFALGGGYNYGYYPQLLNNTTYYFNIKNLDASCFSCNMFIDLSHPGLN